MKMWVTQQVDERTHPPNITRVIFAWFMLVLLIPSKAAIATFSYFPILLNVLVPNCPFFPVVDWTDLVIAFAITDGAIPLPYKIFNVAHWPSFKSFLLSNVDFFSSGM